MPHEPELLNKHQAAKRLGVHWRTVLLFAKDGKLESVSVRDSKTNQMTTKFPVEAVDRLRKERAAPVVNLKPAERPEKPAQQQAIQRSQPRGVDPTLAALLTALVERQSAPVEPKPAPVEPKPSPLERRQSLALKPWLTFAEAVEYTGWPARGLEEFRSSGRLACLDFGKGSRGGRYRFRREDLDALRVVTQGRERSAASA